MYAKIQRWGNSQGVRLHKELLERAQLQVDEEVEIRVQDGVLIITPARKIRGKYNLEDLVARIPKEHEPEEADWGRPCGKEVW